MGGFFTSSLWFYICTLLYCSTDGSPTGWAIQFLPAYKAYIHKMYSFDFWCTSYFDCQTNHPKLKFVFFQVKFNNSYFLISFITFTGDFLLQFNWRQVGWTGWHVATNYFLICVLTILHFYKFCRWSLQCTVDIHSPQTKGFFSVPVFCLTARFLFER